MNGKKLRIALGADHGGFELKERLYIGLQELCEVADLGAYSLDPNDDYPDISLAVTEAVTSGKADRGIIICGSGVGACIAANKVPGIRAGICHDTYSAWQGVAHDDMNVLCLGARIIGVQLAQELVTSFINASFSGKDRYQRRLEKVLDIEQRYSKNT
jgi:ribose 5-phosphate isomerase B